MPQTINIDNFTSLNVIQSTLLDADVTAPGSSVVVTAVDTKDYSVGDYVAFGQLGGSNCEITTITVVGGATSITVTALALVHNRGEAITKLFGSQINLYSAANLTNNPPDDTAFSKISSTQIVPNAGATTIVDPAGGSGFWYKFTYFNTSNSGETQLADSKVIRGGGYGDYATLDEIRAEAGFENNPNILDSDIAKKRQRAQNVINGLLTQDYALPFSVPVPPLINTCTILLAAGWLLMEDYGTSSTGMSKDGQAKIDQVIAPSGDKQNAQFGIIDYIKMREIILLDDAGNSLLLADLTSSYPDSSTPTWDTVSGPNKIGGDRYFSMGDRF